MTRYLSALTLIGVPAGLALTGGAIETVMSLLLAAVLALTTLFVRRWPLTVLILEFLLVAVFIGLCFRSVVVMLTSILPGIFPVVLSGTLLWLMGQGLQFASVVALTVSFGLGLSATIHFLNRMRLEDAPGEDAAAVVERATVLVGPALILTSLVLACGLAMTVFSDLPSLRIFGWLSAFAMLAALTADLLILRPTALFLTILWRRMKHRPATQKPAE